MAYETGDPLENPQWVALYPDLVQSGGLSAALQRLFKQSSADVDVAKELGRDKVSPGWAFIRRGSRKSQVSSAQFVRSFCVDFWNLGMQYGRGSTDDLAEVARAIVMFLLQEGSTARMKSDFSWFEVVGDGSLVHEKPAASYVTRHWQALENWLTSEECPPEKRQLLLLVSEAAKRPQLRQLLPFTSMYRLCFSRTTGFPWVQVDCIAWPTTNRLFRITSINGSRVLLGEGDAVEAADTLVANLPPNCGPAIHGTAETWEHSREDNNLPKSG